MNEQLQITGQKKLIELAKELKSSGEIANEQERVVNYCLTKEHFAVLANRMMIQGIDPESIRLLNPQEFGKVAEIIGMTVEEAAEAINVSHKAGPAALENNSLGETMWLLLATLSPGEVGNVNMADRIMVVANAIKGIREMASKSKDELLEVAAKYKQDICENVLPVEIHPTDGIPIYNDQLGFFAAYRNGYKAAALNSGSRRMIGTIPETSLEELGLKVDKTLSPQFGIRMKKY